VASVRNHSVAVRTDLDAGRTLECVITHGNRGQRLPAALGVVLPAHRRGRAAPPLATAHPMPGEKAPGEPTTRAHRLRRKEASWSNR
jgi:hypothetical protein